MPTPTDLVTALAPYARRIAAADLSDPDGVQATLNREFPATSLDGVRALLVAGHGEGWLTPRVASDTLRFGRVSKPTEALAGCSLDAVDLAGAGAAHTHPNGEVSLCFGIEGDPRFLGCPDGWVVAGRGSRHVPLVTGGRMLIVYFLPGGAMVWE